MLHFSHMSFEQLARLFAVWFIAQTAVVFVASFIFPDFIVLGTNLLSPVSAAVYSMFVLALFAVGSVPLLELLQDMRHRNFITTEWMLFYFAVNSAGLWIISRFAEQLGLGLASWMTAALLGLVMSFVQGFFAMRMGSES